MDKTVTVLRFDDLTGKPIAFWINYPVHAVVMGPENYQITGDIAGATSRFVEQHYLGNDRPRSDMGMLLRLRPEEKGTGEGDRAVDERRGRRSEPDLDHQRRRFHARGRARKDPRRSRGSRGGEHQDRADASLRGAHKVVTCPGRRVEPGPTAGRCKFNDADPVNIRLSLLAINDIALAGSPARCSR